MNFNLNTVLSLLVAFQLFFIALFLFTNGVTKRKSNVLLGIFFLLLAINVCDILFQINRISSFFSLFFLLDDAFLLLFGPLIYLYTLSVVYEPFTYTRKHVWHFVPFAIGVLGLFFLYTLVGSSYQNSLVVVTNAEAPKGAALIFIVLLYLHGGIYLWLSKQALKTYDRVVKEQYSNPGRIDLGWAHFMVNSFLIIWVMGMAQSMVPYIAQGAYVNITLFFFVAYLFYFINRVLFRALRDSKMFMGIPYTTAEKYAKSSLSEDKRKKFAEALESKMEGEQWYLNPDLTLKDVAQSLGLPSKELSQIINQSFDKNFFDFVNSYRIDLAKTLLSDDNSAMTIQEVMYAVGFSSKSSFNTIFKRKMKQTPSEFRSASLG
ncbi:AraC family transcriptional regulator [Flavobacteriaceae bacterium 3-367]|uniref:helix-turn-helix domain-containing protein n=1 Tax=Eudoraea algarum TaxID=3417568 RepID=UPI003275624D